MKQTFRSVGARAVAPLVAVLDHRLQNLAVRIESHTTNLAAQQQRRFDEASERSALDLRVVDEHLLAIERATRRIEGGSPFPEAITTGSSALLLVVPPGISPVPVPDGYRVAGSRSYEVSADGSWREATSREGASVVRVVQLEPVP